MMPHSGTRAKRTTDATWSGPLTETQRHDVVVDAWLERSAVQGSPREVVLELFSTALIALWTRSSTTLGDVTLTAIADRVLHNAAEAYPAFAALKVESNGRIHARDLVVEAAGMNHSKLIEGMRFVLVEFLTVLGNLTAGLLTPELHAELSAITPGPAREAPSWPIRAPKSRPRDNS